MKTTCANCGKAIERFKCKIENRTNVFCDRKCQGQWMSKNLIGEKATAFKHGMSKGSIFNCLRCGKKTVRKGNFQKYCSVKCQIHYEYETGTRDKNKITKKANEAIRKNGQPKLRGKIPYLSEKSKKEKSRKISEKLSGKGNPMYGRTGELSVKWKGGITPENIKIRNSFKYTEWRKAVFKRDRYTCKDCGDKRGGNLVAHHKKAFCSYPELRFEVSNGKTLCERCHIKTHKKRHFK